MVKRAEKKGAKMAGGRKPAPEPLPDELTGKELLFALAYTGEARFNGTEACRRAGYQGSDEVLAVTASRLLRKDKVSEFVEARLTAAKMTSDEVLMELADIARADWREFVEVKHGKEGEVVEANLRLADKLKALELVGRHHKLFTDKHEHAGRDGGAIEHKVVFEVMNGGGATDNQNPD